MLDEVDEHVVAEGLVRGKERAPAVHLGDLLDERGEVARGIEHEGVDANAISRTPHDFAQREVDRLVRRRVREVRVTLRIDVGGGLTISDHDYLLGARLLREHGARQHEPVLHVGAVHVVPGHLG